jgi:hypothetical protein
MLQDSCVCFCVWRVIGGITSSVLQQQDLINGRRMKNSFWSFIWIVAGALILVDKTTMAEAPVEVPLLELAKTHFNDIKPAEQNLFETFFRNTANGLKTDCTRGSDVEDDPANAGAWKENRIIRAEWLSWLCTDPQAAGKVTSRGIEIAGARIDGRVDLAWAKIQFPLRTFKCAFTGKIVLDRSFLVGLYLQGTYIKDLEGDSPTVERDIFFGDGFRGEGQVWLRNATVGRNLQCDGGQFIKVWLDGASIGGNLECDGGKFINPRDIALNLVEAKVGSLYLRNIKAEGEVRLQNATAPSRLTATSLRTPSNPDLRNSRVETTHQRDYCALRPTILGERLSSFLVQEYSSSTSLTGTGIQRSMSS